MIPYGKQDVTEADIDSVVDVLQSDFLTQGPVVPQFENLVANICDANYAVAVNSATSALHIACLSLDLGPGDCLWTTPITFVATANCAIYCGADVDFVDIDPLTYNLCPIQLEKKLHRAEKENKLPKIVIPVHHTGQSCDMEAIFKLSRKYGFRIIEDASHAIGGMYQGNLIGSCKYSDISVFSFHPVKIITTGEGGMAVTNSKDLSEQMALLRSHGITRDPASMGRQLDGPWYYQQIELGFNYRMSDIQAALGKSQLDRLKPYVTKRNELAISYDVLLSGLPIMIPWQAPENYSARHLYVIRLCLDSIEKSHLEIFQLLRDQGIGVNLHYIPVHTQPYYKERGYRAGDFPESEKYYKEAITLPLFPTMAVEEQEKVVSLLRRALH